MYKSVYFGKTCCISLFEYNIYSDYFCSFKNTNKSINDIITGLDRSSKVMFDKMMILDYLVCQQDRHMSNIALCNNRLYPAFDNGECFGIGSTGYFSEGFRRYVERLDKRYIDKILSIDLSKVRNILPLDKFKIFIDNYNNLR